MVYTCFISTGYPVKEKNINTDKATAVLAVIFVFTSCVNQTSFDTVKSSDFYHLNKNQHTSEWKLAKDVIFICPPVIPKNSLSSLPGTPIYIMSQRVKKACSELSNGLLNR
jgi:hypothetical protein